jgi:hypothetical protein
LGGELETALHQSIVNQFISDAGRDPIKVRLSEDPADKQLYNEAVRHADNLKMTASCCGNLVRALHGDVVRRHHSSYLGG